MPPSLIEKSSISDAVQVLPVDEYNQTLVANVHPLDWLNPEPAGRYNLLVIGGGPAGLVAAIGAAGLGAKVAMIEKHLLGGDCLNVGCVPSKALIRAGRAYAAVRDAHEFGVQVPQGTTVDFEAVMERMRRKRAGMSHHDSVRRLTDLGIDVFLGSGEFSNSNEFRIDGKSIKFSKACIATGARASAPPIPGLEGVEYLTNETVFTLTELPRRLAFIGAGPIGCELSQVFSRFGSESTLISSKRGVLPKEERDAAEIIERSLLRDGVDIRAGARDLQVRKVEDGIQLAVDTNDLQYELTFDKLVIAVGRAPNVENLGLESAGVDYDKGGVKIDDHLRTTNPNIFAAGDVASKYQFTHAADFMARLVIRNALFFGRGKASALTIPWTTYTDPELAHIGKSEKELQDQGADFQTFTIKLDEVDRAILDGEDEGFVKVHSNRKGRILGATIVAAHAGDMIGEISLAMTNRLTLGAIANTIHPYPTQAEAIRKVGDAYNRTRLTPFVKKAMSTVLAWGR